MAENSSIEWCDHTFNPWIGCSKVHAGCANCYAEDMMDTRYGKVEWGPGGTRQKTKTWGDPVRWNRQAPFFIECANPECRFRRAVLYGQEETFCPHCGDPEGNSARPRVFCASLADVFEDWEGPIVDHNGEQLFWPHNAMQSPTKYVLERECAGDEPPVTMNDLRRDLFGLIDSTPHLDWLLLTKRPENVARMWCEPTDGHADSPTPHSDGRHNVWLGTSVSDQASTDKQIPELLNFRDLSPVLFVSCEPLLGPIDLSRVGLQRLKIDCRNGGWGVPQNDGQPMRGNGGLDWIIAGGESGANARPMHADWVRGLRDQCAAAGVPFLLKQWGEWAPLEVCAKPAADWKPCGVDRTHIFDDGEVVFRIGKKAAGRKLDGRICNEFPAGHNGIEQKDAKSAEGLA